MKHCKLLDSCGSVHNGACDFCMFGMGATNSSTMGMQQQQQQGVYGNMQAGAQNVQSMVGLQNQTQNPNFTQQIQQNQQ
ncbi:hypothetical protein ZEAMMB73_Zm00001d008527 [Zea mays]|uniref:Uncharacterized protein n=1 Tax=Zea mays TaxID=4577 RepID=A0A1D6FDS7_MAIZE|nr:hypothetical protein ZEAMMB73_Zm00001d008527 [Zea mays]